MIKAAGTGDFLQEGGSGFLLWSTSFCGKWQGTAICNMAPMGAKKPAGVISNS